MTQDHSLRLGAFRAGSLIALALAAASLAACDPNGGARPLVQSSGVTGAGGGPSTAAARQTSPALNKGKGDSTQNNNGPYAGGPH